MVVLPAVRVRFSARFQGVGTLSFTPCSSKPPGECPTAIDWLWNAASQRRHVPLLLTLVAMLISGCSEASRGVTQQELLRKSGRAEDLIIVDCLLPGQIRRLGTQATILMPRRPAQTPAPACGIRRGE